MPANNLNIADIFEQIADSLAIQGANFFRIRAYRQAARQLRDMGEDIGLYVKRGQDLSKLPAIGHNLATKIMEILESGNCATLTTLQKKTPSGLVDLLHIPGLGPKRVHALYHELGVHTPEQVLRAAKDGRIASLAGLGEKIQANILHTLESKMTKKTRMKLSVAARYAEPFADYLRQVKGVEQVVIAGSYRRGKETVGDIDILVTSVLGRNVIEAFTHYEQVRDVLSKGDTRSSVILYSGLQVDVRVVPNSSYGAALYYFTGSKAHNIALRSRAKQRGLKINEYGVYRANKLIGGQTEESVLSAVDLPWIPPELRENDSEFEAAQKHTLPNLVMRNDIKGDLHAHTTATDGHHSLTEMARAAQSCGLEYLAITEHSKRLTVAHGLNETRLAAQIDEIDKLNAQFKGFTLLKGIEVDILDNGELDLSDGILAKLDLVIGAVHSNFHLSRDKQTERILCAMDNPHFTLLAHPTGRLLENRQAYDVDMLRIIRQAKQRGCYLELNAQPMRLDLSALHCQMAKNEGVLISINSDAHSVNDFNNLHYGVSQARRGWLEKSDVLNTRSLTVLRKLFANR
jgi:DNA polymerase (family 10)